MISLGILGNNAVFVFLVGTLFSLVLLPVLVEDSFAGTPIILPPPPPPPPGGLVILYPAPGALPPLPGFPDNPQTNPLLGDFKCYEVGNDIPDVSVFLIDQFEERDYVVNRITEVCNYVLKGENVDVPFPPSQDVDPVNGDANQHYKVYDIRDPSRQITILEDVLLRDQFGDTRHMVLIPVELWVPQAKSHIVCPPGFDYDPFAPPGFECQTDDPQLPCNPPFANVAQPPPFCGGPSQIIPVATQDTDIHWKCYEVEPQTPNQQVFLQLDDKNFGKSANELLDLYKICTPVEKIVQGCLDGYTEDQGVCFNSAPPFNQIPLGPISFGDSTIDDHLKCYRINPDELFFFPFGVIYEGQFGADDFFAPVELEVCLVASKLHVPESAVGGSFIPIDTTSLVLLGAQTTVSWLIPVLVSAVGIGFVILRRR